MKGVEQHDRGLRGGHIADAVVVERPGEVALLGAEVSVGGDRRPGRKTAPEDGSGARPSHHVCWWSAQVCVGLRRKRSTVRDSPR